MTWIKENLIRAILRNLWFYSRNKKAPLCAPDFLCLPNVFGNLDISSFPSILSLFSLVPNLPVC